MDTSTMIYEMLDDSQEEENELGYTFKNNYDVTTEFKWTLQTKCPKCATLTKVSEDLDLWCSKCHNYCIETPFSDIKDDCNYKTYEIEETKEVTGGNDQHIYKIKLTGETYGTVYGIMNCEISWEPNSWSSTPHHNMFRRFYIYENIEERDKEW